MLKTPKLGVSTKTSPFQNTCRVEKVATRDFGRDYDDNPGTLPRQSPHHRRDKACLVYKHNITGTTAVPIFHQGDAISLLLSCGENMALYYFAGFR
ncbi:hypothetical protein JWG39_13810 [Desulforhopalus vacuolatus]|uniref:hypothetical protein n=1 Tax=Desulforhopalus vacuolatus TaxID=40414 RepID=UPI001962D0C7|nr:hypothetical protein [Desulforhopalus vacuolatus]MBM9520890.1 hypothetical protein [Desulforhopalus vacuolatus]